MVTCSIHLFVHHLTYNVICVAIQTCYSVSIFVVVKLRTVAMYICVTVRKY